jgi:hypothetical protein
MWRCHGVSTGWSTDWSPGDKGAATPGLAQKAAKSRSTSGFARRRPLSSLRDFVPDPLPLSIRFGEVVRDRGRRRARLVVRKTEFRLA